MIKTYRKTGTIKAERFDNSREMAEKYHVEYDEAYVLPFRIETPDGWLGMEVGDWISTGANGEHWIIADDLFNKTYTDLPVIPKAVSEYIQWGKSYDIQLYMMYNFKFIHSQGFKKLTDDVESWIISSSDTFARAWLDGYKVEVNEP